MEALPPVQAGYIRFVLFPEEKTWKLDPGMLIKMCQCGPEHVGHIQIKRQKVYIDIHNAVSHQVREALQEHGRCTVAENGLEQLKWSFIRLGIGRNHGLNVGQLKKLMKRIKAGPLGKISINNSYTLIGLREDFIKQALQQLSGMRINGFASQARFAQEREVGRREAQFQANKPRPEHDRPQGQRSSGRHPFQR